MRRIMYSSLFHFSNCRSHCCRRTSRAEAFRRALGTDDFQGNEATEWGTVNEPNGIAYYEQVTGNKVIETGLHTHPNFHWIAGSPDGLVGTEGMVEIKCPFYKRTPLF